jgi:transposase
MVYIASHDQPGRHDLPEPRGAASPGGPVAAPGLRALLAQVAQLATDNQELRVEVERLTRQSKRQATPFSKGTRTKHPTRPGRQPGQGTFSFRYVTDLPPLPQPRVTQYRVGVCRCTGCGRQGRGEHPDLAPDQYGATAHRLGARAKAVAHILHYQVGIPVRKVPLVLGLLTGLELTQGAITQDALRRAKGSIGQKYQELRAGVGESRVVYTDDTGWKVGGESAHLMAFDTDQATVYQVRPRHRHQEVQEVIPRNYQGVMGTDRGRSYEDKSFRWVKQRKCLAHLQRTLSGVLDRKEGRARDLAAGTKELLHLAVGLWKEYHYGDRKEFDQGAPEVRLALSDHLRDRPFKDRDNRKLLRMLHR